MLGLNASIDADVLEFTFKFFVAHFRELCAGNSSVTLTQDAQLLCYGHRRVDMVARYHYGAYSGLAALVDSGLNLRTHGVYHARKSDEAELTLQRLGLGAVRHLVPHAHRAGQNAQCPVGHELVVFKYLGAVGLRHGNGLPVFKIVRAFSDDDVRCALGVLNDSVRSKMQGAHHLSARVEGRFATARICCLKLRFIELQ